MNTKEVANRYRTIAQELGGKPDPTIVLELVKLSFTLDNSKSKNGVRAPRGDPTVLKVIKEKGAICKTDLVFELRKLGIGRERAVKILNQAVSRGALCAFRVPVPGGVTWHGTASQIEKLKDNFWKNKHSGRKHKNTGERK